MSGRKPGNQLQEKARQALQRQARKKARKARRRREEREQQFRQSQQSQAQSQAEFPREEEWDEEEEEEEEEQWEQEPEEQLPEALPREWRAEREHAERHRRERREFFRELARVHSQALEKAAEEEQAKKHFEDAMNNGYVECTMTTCAVTGAAGSGKSHTMSLVFNEDPPTVRESTGLREPVRAVSTVVGSSESDKSEWTRVDEGKVLNIVAEATSVSNTKEKTTVLTPFYAEIPEETSGSYAAEGSSNASDGFDPSDISYTEGSSNPSCKTEGEKQASHTGVVDELLGKLANLLKVSGDRKRVAKLDFLYFLDSGGQPQFHELLPSFIPNLSAILFVLKLSEKLNDNPKVEFYEKGELVCSYQSPYSHEQILKHCIRTLQPVKSSIENSTSSSPCIAIVGTHRDLELSCEGETREEKNQKLLDLLQPRFGNSLIFYENLKKLIFPVNAKEPSEEDRAVADVLREAIIHLSAPKPVKIPLPWFILEQVLRKLAKERGTGVMHIDRCREVAKRLHIEHDAFDAALKYLVSLKIFLYYPTVLPKVLFCEPQVALDNINELVERHRTLCGGPNTLPGNATSSCMRGLSGKRWLRFQSFGIFQEKLLHDEAFSGHYDQDLFTPSDMLKLLEALRIVGKVNTTDVIPEYVMPSLLFELKPDDLEKHRCNPATSPAAPLLIHFTGWPASGVFCSFLTSLLSTCNWEVMIDERNKPTCLYRNCLELQHPEMLGKITLIDSFVHGYFEVHVHAPLEECKFCPEIHQALFTALPRKAPEAELAFFCPKSGSTGCSSSLHLARISPKRNYNCWRCSEKPGEVYGYVSDLPNMIVWGIGMQVAAEEPKVDPQNPTPGVSTEQQDVHYDLGFGELIDIGDYLVNLKKDQIFRLGLVLGLRAVPTLDVMRDSPTFLYDMLTVWLQGQDDVGRRGGHTWETLVNGLKHPSVAQNETADRIREEKCKRN